jgi:hypothetical protein
MQIAFMFSAITTLIIQALLLLPAQAQEKQRVPENFSYPESPEIIQINKAIKSKSISGIITDPSGAAASEVLVERLEANWGKRIEAILTDSKGYFAFTRNTPGVYFLKISKPGFNSMLLKVEVTTRKANSSLKIGLRVST